MACFGYFIQIVFAFLFIFCWIFKVIINSLTICFNNCTNIERCFHSAFDFQADNACINQIRNMVDHAKVFGVIDICSSFVFFNGHVFAGTCFFYQMVFPAARMGTSSLIGVTTAEVIAQQASAGIRNAHSAMHKGFDFHICRNFFTDFTNFTERKFSGNNHTSCAQLIPHTSTLVVCVVCLCRNMDFQIRCRFSCYSKYTQIRNQYSVCTQFVDFLEIVSHAFKIRIVSKDISCDIYFRAMFMGKADTFRHSFFIEIFCFCTQTICFAADVNSISAIQYRDF